ncbi:MAG: hypothetical protein AAF658_16160 [Myxococcota bacterium]
MRNQWVRTASLGAVVVTAVTALVYLTFFDSLSLAPVVIDERWIAGALLGGVGRIFAFRIYRRARISVDSPIYISVAFQLSVLSAAWLVLVVLGLDGVVRTGSRLVRSETLRAPVWRMVLERLYIAAAPVLVLLIVGALFRLDTVPKPLELEALFVLVPTFTASFLVLHYFAAGGLHWFDGSPSKAILRMYFARVVTVELALIPLTLALIVTLTERTLSLRSRATQAGCGQQVLAVPS